MEKITQENLLSLGKEEILNKILEAIKNGLEDYIELDKLIEKEPQFKEYKDLIFVLDRNSLKVKINFLEKIAEKTKDEVTGESPADWLLEIIQKALQGDYVEFKKIIENRADKAIEFKDMGARIFIDFHYFFSDEEHDTATFKWGFLLRINSQFQL